MTWIGPVLGLIGVLMILGSWWFRRKGTPVGPWFRPRPLASVYEPRGVWLVRTGLVLTLASLLARWLGR